MQKRPTRWLWLVGLLIVQAATMKAVAADNGTEFGIEDDLTVSGTNGDINDADVEIKGYSVFGSNTNALSVTNGPGNVFIGGNLEVASNLVVNSVTVQGGELTASNLHVLGGLQVEGEQTNARSIKVSANMTVGGSATVAANLTVSNALAVNGGFTNTSTTTYTPGTEQALDNGGSVSITGLTYVKIRGNAAPVTALGDPPIAPGAAGQIIILQGNDSIRTVTFTNSAALVLEGSVPFTMGSNDIMQLVYDGNTWVEVYRSCK